MKLPAETQYRHVAVCVDQFRSHGRGVMAGIAEYVEIFGPWSLFIDSLADSNYSQGRSKNWKGDGILTYIESPARAQRLRARGIPTVELFGYRLDGKLPLVANDDVAVGKVAAEHLIERHFKQFAFTGYAKTLWSDQRKKGFSGCLVEKGFARPACLDMKKPSTIPEWERVQKQLVDWIRRLPRPIGLMACSDKQAQRVLDACQRAGIVVPDEVAVIGVDNDEETCRLSNPPLTSVINDARKIGYEGAKLLDGIMSGKAKRSAHRILIPPIGVATRRSTDVTAIEDRLIANAARFIRENASQELDIEKLVQQFGLSRSSFYGRFQAALGRSPHSEILRVQLERVKNLLLQTSLSLEKIAEMAGFRNPEYLSVAFKREIGVPPGEYRKGGKAIRANVSSQTAKRVRSQVR